MGGYAISFVLVLFATLNPQPQSAATADADLWIAAVEQVRRDLQVQHSGELLILNQTIPTSEFHIVRDSTRETHLLELLRQRNDSTRKSITGVRLPARTRLIEANSVQNWADMSKQFPGTKLVRFSLPAFPEDGTKAMLYYSASGGFDDSQGGYLVFEKKGGQWTAVDAFGVWIT